MNKREIVAAQLAEWGYTLSEHELDQILPAYENLLRWRGVVHGMLRSRNIAEGMNVPESEPLLVHAMDKGGPQR
ncbi:MAG: hypothetical protein AB7G75_25995 [Candidatus Binatia bacterium]